jgi:flavorubredoxin
MHDFLHHLQIKNYQKRRVGIIENGSWAPCAGRVMRDMLAQMKDVEIAEPMVTILSRMKQGDRVALEALADAMLK